MLGELVGKALAIGCSPWSQVVVSSGLLYCFGLAADFSTCQPHSPSAPPLNKEVAPPSLGAAFSKCLPQLETMPASSGASLLSTCNSSEADSRVQGFYIQTLDSARLGSLSGLYSN